MPYVLGIDIGVTHMSAAVSRAIGSAWSLPEVVWLDEQSCAVPSVVHVSPNGSFTVGDPGQNGATVDGGQIARGFIRRIGDDVPLILAGDACLPQTLVAVLAMWVVERVATWEGGYPEHIVLSHPASWGPYRKALVSDALWEIGLADVTLLPEPVTAAEVHASRNQVRDTLGIYSLRDNEFITAVVRRADPTGFELLGCMESVEPFGGEDFDETLANHVRAALGPSAAALTPLGLRDECAYAREKLTVADETDVVVQLPHGPQRVPIRRADFEDMIRPALRLTMNMMIRTTQAAGLQPEQLDGVLLVGESSRIPLVSELISAEFPCSIMVETDPEIANGMGAALAARELMSPPDAEPRREDQMWWPSAVDDQDNDELPPRPPIKITKLKLSRRRSATSVFRQLGHA